MAIRTNCGRCGCWRVTRVSGTSGRTSCLAHLAQCKILGHEGIKPHKVRYYLERRDAEFEQKMAEVLCVYRQVQVLTRAAGKSRRSGVSYDEKPEIAAGLRASEVVLIAPLIAY